MLLDEILKIASDKNASDVLITIGISPKCRVNGELINIRDEKLSAEDTNICIPKAFNGCSRWSCIPLVKHTKSGRKDTIFSMLMALPSKPPAEGISATSGGQLQKSVRATKRFSASKAYIVSVMEGLKDTTLSIAFD